MKPAPIHYAFRQALVEAWAGGAGLLLPVGFFGGTVVLVPFSLGDSSALLATAGPGVLWLALALSSLVTLERVFQADLQDGALDLWIQEDNLISLIAAVKILAHFIVSGLPLVLLTPLIGLMFQIPAEATVTAMAVYGLGGLSFFLWGGVAAALSASIARAGLLIVDGYIHEHVRGLVKVFVDQLIRSTVTEAEHRRHSSG
ncbi:MAG: heme exporter protein CcmB, partial [Henriciella sp.]